MPAIDSNQAADPRPLRLVEAPSHNLPPELTSFVGRTRELKDAAKALVDTRLLTLTGAGGCGKSRLALKVASEVLDEFPDGAWWVELAHLADPDLVAATLARVFELRPKPDQTYVGALVSDLSSRRALVILDNCEHLLEACADLAEALIAGCPELTILATSREPLKVPGETDWRVPAMSLPDEGEGSADAGSSDAVSLFVERAGKVRPGFSLDGENAEAVIRVCRELDGMPMAIELAASRLRMLSVKQVADRLQDRFRLLTEGTRTSLPRQRTLRASVDWSHELLDEREQILFRRLGVFKGSYSLEAAEYVCSKDGIETEEVLDLLSSLVDKSLVQSEERNRVVRYRMLETLRQYALERLEDEKETGKIRDRHRDFYLDLAERAEPGLIRRDQLEFLDLLDAEAPNLMQAIDRAAETEPEKALRLCASLTQWWRLRGWFAQGEAGFRGALESSMEEEPSALRARTRWGRAYLLTYLGDFAEASLINEEALAEAEKAGDRSTIARAVWMIGTMMLFLDPRESLIQLERSRKLAAACGEEYWVLLATGTLARSYLTIDVEKARLLLSEVLPLAERLGDRYALAWYWVGVAWADYIQGEYEACRQASLKALDAARDIGDVVTETSATITLALSYIDTGRPKRGVSLLDEMRGRARSRGGNFFILWVDLALGMAAAVDGRLEEARSVFGHLTEEAAEGMVTVLSPAHLALGETLRLLGDAQGAETAGRSGLELAELHDNSLVSIQARVLLGWLAAGRGDRAEAQRLLHEALSDALKEGFRTPITRTLEGLAAVAAGVESHTEAARILGAARREREELGSVPWRHQREELEFLTAGVADALGDRDFKAAFEEGRALSLEDAVSYVRRARGERKRPSSGWESLTPTELQVVRLVANGLTNKEIAQRLFISPRTVQSHLRRIFPRLGISTRAELAGEAARRLS